MTRTVREFSDLDSHGRRVTLLSADSLSEILPLPQLTSGYYGMFLAMDARSEAASNLSDLAACLIKRGLVYLCTWGPDCERVHDMFDWGQIDLEIASEISDEYPLMTAGHEDESLDEALWFFLNFTLPNQEYEGRCAQAFVVSVGNKEWTSYIAGCLSDIPAFNGRVLFSDETEE